MLQKKNIQNDYKDVTTKEGLETANNDLTFIPYCEFQQEGFAREWLLLGLFKLIVLRTLHPCSAKSCRGGREIISCRKFFFHSNQKKTASWISEWFNSLVHRADICLCRSTYSVIQRRKKDSYLQDTTDFLNVESKKCPKIQSQFLWTLLVPTPTHHTKRA